MPKSLSIQTVPSVEPLSTADAKTHLRVGASDRDAYVDDLVASARQLFEDLSGRALITQTWDLWLDAWPVEEVIELPRPPLQSITSIDYYDVDDVSATLASSKYLVDTDSFPGRAILNDGQDWPTTTLRPKKNVRLRFVAGQGNAASDVDAIDVHAIRSLVSHFWENPEPYITGTIVSTLPMHIRSLIYRDRVTMVL